VVGRSRRNGGDVMTAGPARLFVAACGADLSDQQSWHELRTAAVTWDAERDWLIAVCFDCSPVLPQPFAHEPERHQWATAHAQATSHDVRIGREHRDVGLRTVWELAPLASPEPVVAHRRCPVHGTRLDPLPAAGEWRCPIPDCGTTATEVRRGGWTVWSVQWAE